MPFADAHFDVAIIEATLAEMPAQQRAAALKEVDIARVGRNLQSIVAKTAVRLGKKAAFSLVGSGSIDVEVLRVLHRCFVHLVNNSLDHGLEKPQERIAARQVTP